MLASALLSFAAIAASLHPLKTETALRIRGIEDQSPLAIPDVATGTNGQGFIYCKLPFDSAAAVIISRSDNGKTEVQLAHESLATNKWTLWTFQPSSGWAGTSTITVVADNGADLSRASLLIVFGQPLPDEELEALHSPQVISATSTSFPGETTSWVDIPYTLNCPRTDLHDVKFTIRGPGKEYHSEQLPQREGGVNVAAWNLIDESGQRAPTGKYIARFDPLPRADRLGAAVVLFTLNQPHHAGAGHGVHFPTRSLSLRFPHEGAHYTDAQTKPSLQG